MTSDKGDLQEREQHESRLQGGKMDGIGGEGEGNMVYGENYLEIRSMKERTWGCW